MYKSINSNDVDSQTLNGVTSLGEIHSPTLFDPHRFSMMNSAMGSAMSIQMAAHDPPAPSLSYYIENTLKFREYPSWVKYFAYMIVSVSGVWSQVSFKMMNEMEAPLPDGRVTHFSGALLQALLMAIGMLMSLPIAIIDAKLSSNKSYVPLFAFETDPCKHGMSIQMYVNENFDNLFMSPPENEDGNDIEHGKGTENEIVHLADHIDTAPSPLPPLMGHDAPKNVRNVPNDDQKGVTFASSHPSRSQTGDDDKTVASPRCINTSQLAPPNVPNVPKLGSPEEKMEQTDTPIPMGKWWHWTIMGCFNVSSMMLLAFALHFTLTSTVSMVQNLVVVFCAIFQIPLQKRAVRTHEWFGVVVITFALVLTVIPRFSGGGGDEDSSSNQILGIVMAVSGTLVMSVLLQVEELLMKRSHMPPMNACGWEGVGGVFMAGVLWIWFQLSGIEDVNGGVYQIVTSSAIGVTAVLYVVLGAFLFNFSGLAATKLGSALIRSVLVVIRSPIVWVISLGVGWEAYTNWDLAGALVFLLGLTLYANIFLAPFARRGSITDQWMWRHVHLDMLSKKVTKTFVADRKNDTIYPYWTLIESNGQGKCILNASEVPYLIPTEMCGEIPDNCPLEAV